MKDNVANEKMKSNGFKVSLFLYDFLIFLAAVLMLFVLYKSQQAMSIKSIIAHSALSFVCIFGVRWGAQIYQQIWRYGGIQCYIRLLLADTVACLIYLILEFLTPIYIIAFARLLSFCSINLLGSLAIRMFYRYAYKCGNMDNQYGKFLRKLLRIFSFGRVHTEADPGNNKIKVAIIGAGSVGVGLAEDLWSNPQARYIPRCFIDTDLGKIGREIHGIKVFSEDEATNERLKEHEIQQVVLAVPALSQEKKLALYQKYQDAGFKVNVFDYPDMGSDKQKRELREFTIEDLLMREQKDILDEKTADYYKDKVILITGGGGSIGSELCRQLAKMNPKRLVVVDIYENCAYELQQALKFKYKDKLDIRVEIVSITNKEGLARVFEEYKPDICINAAAHKHVPLMEKNCIEAIQNNVFGTLNVIQCCEEYGCGRFLMVSTDKAVNPTNIMGASKRMCEMIMQAYSTRGKVICSATRFGNVLGSAGSVIPLFKMQIAAGGPITLTDKRIIRYFMSIPEASQLVLVSGAMANNGELFVLDMGNPVKIYDLATSMIKMSGKDDIEIIETGLRPGEKLYEELLVKKAGLVTTDNEKIFIEKEEPICMSELEKKIEALRAAGTSDENMRKVMHEVVPTYKTPAEVNAKVQTKKESSDSSK